MRLAIYSDLHVEFATFPNTPRVNLRCNEMNCYTC